MVKKYFKAIRIKTALLGLIFWGLMLHNYSDIFSLKIDHLLLSFLLLPQHIWLFNQQLLDINSDKINKKILRI